MFSDVTEGSGRVNTSGRHEGTPIGFGNILGPTYGPLALSGRQLLALE